MALQTAESILAMALENLRQHIADSRHWQAICKNPDDTYPEIKLIVAADGTIDRSAALAAIVGDTVYEDEDYTAATKPPFVLIRTLPDVERRQTTPSTWHGPILFLMEFHLEVPSSYCEFTREALNNATIDFQNKVGKILEDMQEVARKSVANRLVPINFSIGPMGMLPLDENGERWERMAEITVQASL